MPRGGFRENAGRKSTWESGCAFHETKVIRVPANIADKVLEIAKAIDAGEDVMATKNRRVATYLPEHIEEVFNKFKLEHRLNDSQAIATILANYLGVSQDVDNSRLELLENKVAQIEQLLNTILAQQEKMMEQRNTVPKPKIDEKPEITQGDIFGANDDFFKSACNKYYSKNGKVK